MSSIAPHIEAFLRDHLSEHRGASGHTCDSYAYSFQALFEFAASKLRVAPSALRLDQLDATLIAAFLRHLEVDRGNSAQTRNVRLAAFDRSSASWLFLSIPQKIKVALSD